MKTLTLFLAILLTSIIANAQAPTIQWEKCYGGSSSDIANSINQTNDGGYIVAGYSYSTDGDVSGNHGNDDYWIVKLNAIGDTLWTKTFGGSNDDIANSIIQTNDNGYIVAGYSSSIDGDVNGNHGGNDYWILKLDEIGDTLWTKSLGGSSDDFAKSINQTSDGGYIIAGYSYSIDGDVSENHGNRDYWIIKLNEIGDTIWTKTFGGTNHDIANSIIQTNDSSYIIAGYTSSINGDVSENHGVNDYWIIKLNATGDTIWTKSFGGTADDKAISIDKTSNSGYIIGGYSSSIDGDINGNHGDFDYWIVKLNDTGDTLWTKSLGGSNYDLAISIKQTNDGGYIISGYSNSNDGDVNENMGESDYWILKLNAIGDTLWTKTIGGSNYDAANSIIQTNDGGYIIAGYSYSIDGDVSGNHGVIDYWIVKLSPDTLNSVSVINQKDFILYPNPSTGNIQITMNNEQIGSTIQIVNINGEIVKQFKIQNSEFKIDLSKQAKGIYFVKLISESGVSTQKVVLE